VVLARVSGRGDVVFGTVMFGRMQGGEGADRALGMFINMLPLRIRVGGDGVRASVRQTHELLSQMVRHEQAPLLLAQRCSLVRAPAPLFTSLLNYRHSVAELQSTEAAQRSAEAWTGIELLFEEERTNYPLGMNVDDLADQFILNAQVDASIDPRQVCALMHTALESLVCALEQASAAPLRSLEVLPGGTASYARGLERDAGEVRVERLCP
jgi:non-ribosomal peptide synthetase component F